MKYSLRIIFVLVAIIACGAMLVRHSLRERTYFKDPAQTIDVETTDNAIVIDIDSQQGFRDICWITVSKRLKKGVNWTYGKAYQLRIPFKAVVLDDYVHATIRISLDGKSNEGDIDLLGELKKQTTEKISFKKLSQKPFITRGHHRIEIKNSYRINIDSQESECVLTVSIP